LKAQIDVLADLVKRDYPEPPPPEFLTDSKRFLDEAVAAKIGQ
jgi:hypothetical protein